MKNAVALTVAGSDSGGGAGIQADIKTFSACGVYGASVITAVTAQNLDGVRAIQAIDPSVVDAQLRAVLEGYPVKAIKTGMLFNRDIIDAVAAVLEEHRRVPVVVDPVFAATSGSRLIKPRAVRVLRELIFPLAVLVTPNLPEAEFLCGRELRSLDDLRAAGEVLYKMYKVPFLMKGGHLPDRAVDLLVDGRGVKAYAADLVRGVNSHGSGCTFSAAIAAYLARGRSLRVAVAEAKTFITASLRRPHYLRPGTRVIDHFHRKGRTSSTMAEIKTSDRDRRRQLGADGRHLRRPRRCRGHSCSNARTASAKSSWSRATAAATSATPIAFRPGSTAATRLLLPRCCPASRLASAIDFFEELGIACKTEKEGRVYPHSGQASAVLDVMRWELERLEVDVRTGHEVKRIVPGDAGFALHLNAGGELKAKRVILAAGGAAGPQFGSDGSGLRSGAGVGPPPGRSRGRPGSAAPARRFLRAS